MIYAKTFRQITIKTKDPEEYDRQMNAVFAAHGQPEIQDNSTPEMFCTTVRYWVRNDTPETLGEWYEQNGGMCKCSDCPVWPKIAPTDGRRKNVHCEHYDGYASANSWACEYYYAAFKNINDLKRILGHNWPEIAPQTNETGDG